MRALFVTIPEKGHLNPMIGPAQYLLQKGHEVRFFAARDVRPQLSRAGLTQLDPPRAHPAAHNRGATFAAQIQDRAWLRSWIRALLLEAVPEQLPGLRAAVDRFHPDVMAIDPMVYAAVIVAHERGLPWAGLSSSLNPVVRDQSSELIETVRAFAGARDALFSEHGLQPSFRVCDALSEHLNVVFSAPQLVGPPPEGIELVGPSIPLGARGDEAPLPQLSEERPLIYMSLGSQIYHQPRMFRAVIEATEGRDVQLLLSAGKLADELVLPEHVVARAYVPQLRVLSRARAMITHGGANSVMEALHFGVPLLISPIVNDQFHQASFIRSAKVGLSLDLGCASPEQIWTALESLLNGPPGLPAVHQAYAQNGALRAAELLEALGDAR